MKLQVDKKVYLQVYDMIFIACELGEYPKSIAKEAFSDDDSDVLLALEDEAEKLFWFEYVFQEPENIEWLMAQDWIISYNDYAEALISELDVTEYLFNKELIARMEAYISSRDEREIADLNKLEHKVMSIDALAAYRREKISFRFPEGFHVPRKRRFSFWAWLLGEE